MSTFLSREPSPCDHRLTNFNEKHSRGNVFLIKNHSHPPTGLRSPPACAPGWLQAGQVATGHHRVGAYTSGKNLGQLEDAGSPMSKIPPGLDINATKKLAPHVSADGVL
jgi:hypothetical protein